VAAEQVPEGLDLAVQKMKRGEVAEVTLAPRYAFGAEGAQRAAGAVPPDAPVTYTVELKEFENVRLGTHELCNCRRCVQPPLVCA
jgi:FKBP-type peptidyl-prolyl cis-trans isomerase